MQCAGVLFSKDCRWQRQMLWKYHTGSCEIPLINCLSIYQHFCCYQNMFICSLKDGFQNECKGSNHSAGCRLHLYILWTLISVFSIQFRIDVAFYNTACNESYLCLGVLTRNCQDSLHTGEVSSSPTYFPNPGPPKEWTWLLRLLAFVFQGVNTNPLTISLEERHPKFPLELKV